MSKIKLTLGQQQRLNDLTVPALVAAFLASPFYFCLFAAGYTYIKHTHRTLTAKIPTYLGGAACAFFFIFIERFIRDPLSLCFPPTILNWLFVPKSLVVGLDCFALCLYSLARFVPSDQMLLERSEQERQARQIHLDDIPIEHRTHIAVLGTTGSGKTTALMRYVAHAMEHNQRLYIVSGKNGTDDNYSLLNQVKRLAQARGYQLLLVSLNEREPMRQPYNPLAEMSPTEAADALTAISEYTEPHYKAVTTSWLKAICECLIAAGTPLSLNAICEYYDYSALNGLLTKLCKAGTITKEDVVRYRSLAKIAEEASLSKSRYANLLMGEGASLFGNGLDCCCASQVKDSKTIFFLDLDSFRYEDFTRSIGKLFIADLRHVISVEADFNQEKDVILDELGSFATEQLLPICAQARSYGYQLIVASQSIADLEAVSDTFTERLMENCGQYCVLQLNSAKDAEFMANLFGTFTTTETTYVSLDQRLGDGVKGTKRLVHEYRISPDEIKGIPPLTAFFYNKRRPDVVYKVKVPFTEG